MLRIARQEPAPSTAPNPAQEIAIMTAARKTSSSRKSSSRSGAPAGAVDAIQLLIDDHKAVKQLFTAYGKLVKAGAPPPTRNRPSLRRSACP
jgi:hypothetical protein